MKYVLIGKIVNTHGLKGELRILSSFKYINKVLIKGMSLYIGSNKIHEEINSYRHHKIFEMITLKNYNDINQVLKYKGEYVFINKGDLKLDENEYLDEDIIGNLVYTDSKELGIVRKIENHNGNEVLVVRGDNKEYRVPYNFEIIENVDLINKRIIVKNIKGLFD